MLAILVSSVFKSLKKTFGNTEPCMRQRLDLKLFTKVSYIYFHFVLQKSGLPMSLTSNKVPRLVAQTIVLATLIPVERTVHLSVPYCHDFILKKRVCDP